jgi:hypothetical protein
MSGFQVLPQLVKNVRTHAAPVIVLTHLMNPFILDVAVKNGAFSALCKSFTPADILDKLILRALLPMGEITSLVDKRMRLLFFLSYGRTTSAPDWMTGDDQLEGVGWSSPHSSVH